MKNKQRINTGNKGFSLVELIVVVLIMGVLAVGLTPQVIKWVNNARIASDIDYMHNLESGVQYALIDPDVLKEVTDAVVGAGSDIVLVVDSSGTHDKDNPAGTSELLKRTAEKLGFGSDTVRFKDHKIRTSGNIIEIHINSGRAIGKYTTTSGSEVEIEE